MAIRFDKAFNAEIRRAINRVNKKIVRAQKAGNQYVPQRISIREFKNRYKAKYSSRRELRRELAALNRANISDLSESVELARGGRISLYAAKETERKRIRLLRRVNRDIRKMQEREYGDNLVFAKTRLQTLQNIQSSLEKGSRDSEYQVRRINTMYAQEFSAEKKDSFENALYDTISEQMKFNGLSPDQNDELLAKLKMVDIDTLIKMNRDDEDFSEILDRYKGKDQYNKEDKEAVKKAWQDIYNKIDGIIEKSAK